jgi:hypothetical protein
VPHDQLLADDQLIEAVRAGRVDEHHSDPVARLLARWRTGITTGMDRARRPLVVARPRHIQHPAGHRDIDIVGGEFTEQREN